MNAADDPARIRVLVTGFEPFGGSPLNPSMLAARATASRRWPGAAVRACILPVVGGTGPGSARRILEGVMDAFRPHAVLLLGEACTRGAVSVERVARNEREYPIADNAGGVVRGMPVVAGAPGVLGSALPVDDLIAVVRALGIPAECSSDAGRFLCNEVMFHVLDQRSRTGSPAFAGFIHLPQLPEQHALRPVEARPMPLDETVDAVRAIVGRVVGLCVRGEK